jgi:hypothetical protein
MKWLAKNPDFFRGGERREHCCEWILRAQSFRITTPLFGRLVPEGRTVFVDPDHDMTPYPDQWEVLSSVKRMSQGRLQAIAESTCPEGPQADDASPRQCQRIQERLSQLRLGDCGNQSVLFTRMPTTPAVVQTQEPDQAEGDTVKPVEIMPGIRRIWREDLHRVSANYT